MDLRTEKVESEIKVGGFGAVDTDDEKVRDGFHLIEWKGLPYVLQEPTIIFGCYDEKEMMPVGTTVCEGIFRPPIDRVQGWYQSPNDAPFDRAKRELIWTQHVLSGDVQSQTGQTGTFFPKKGVEQWNLNNPAKLQFVFEDEIDTILIERMEKHKLELIEIVDWTNEEFLAEIKVQDELVVVMKE